MYRLILLALAAVSTASGSLSSQHQACFSSYNTPVSEDQLLGTWYEVQQYTLFGGLVPSTCCTPNLISKPTEEELQAYKTKYNSVNKPYSIDDSPLLLNKTSGSLHIDGLLMGDKAMKFYVLQPYTTMTLGWNEYAVRAYVPTSNPDFLLYFECEFRYSSLWLWSRIQHPTNEQLAEIAKDIEELRNKSINRFCWA